MQLDQHRECPVCNGFFEIFSVNDWGRRLARCRGCAHVFVQNPLPWHKRLEGFQGLEYFTAAFRHLGITSLEDDAQWNAWTQDRVRTVSELLPGERLRMAEVGCLEGRMLSGLAALGHTVCGCDLNVEVVEKSRRQLGLDIYAGTVGASLPRWGEQDVLLAFHILNFTECPASALGEWLRLLKPGGRALVVVPLEQQDRGYHLCLQYFSRSSLKALAETFFATHTLNVLTESNDQGVTLHTAFLIGERPTCRT